MAKRRFIRTSEVARAAGTHPNTVRIYEAWGYLPPVERTSSGYRMFTQAHVDQMILARTALVWPYPGGKAPVLELVKCAAEGDFERALALAYGYHERVCAELGQAEAAAAYLEHWAHGALSGSPGDGEPAGMLIGAAAVQLACTVDQLRNWERNGLLKVRRDPQSGYRRYGPAELGRARVIRLLLQVGYSVMAVLRMLLLFESGKSADLRAALDTPRPDEDVVTVADRWLSTLAEQEQRARDIIALLVTRLVEKNSGNYSTE